MRLSAGELRDALKATGYAVANRPSAPFLAGVRIASDGPAVVFSATDLETWITSTATADSDGALDVLVSHKTLSAIAKVVRSATVELSLTADRSALRIIGGGSEWSAPLIAAEPLRAPTVPALIGSVDADVLRRMTKASAPAAGRDMTPPLQPLQVHVRDGEVQLSATDGHRIHLTREPFKPDGDDASAMPDAGSVSRIIEALQGEVRLFADAASGLFGLEDERTRVLVRMIADPKIPDLAKFLDGLAGRWRASTVVDAAALEDALRSVTPAVATNHGVMVTVSTDGLTVEASSEDARASASVADYEHDGDGIRCLLNVAYLLEALGALNAPRVQVQWWDPQKPVLLTAEGSTTQCTVMPIRSTEATWLGVVRDDR